MKLLFVCTGNTCRSPLAEAIARKVAIERGLPDVEASSAGTSAWDGAPASDAVLDPGFTNYARTVLYTTHDVTALLRQGENVIATELGSGQFDDQARTWDWGWHLAEWRATPRLRLDLYVTYADGTTDTTTTAVHIGGYMPLFDGTAASFADWAQIGPGKWTLTPEGKDNTQLTFGMATDMDPDWLPV